MVLREGGPEAGGAAWAPGDGSLPRSSRERLVNAIKLVLSTEARVSKNCLRTMCEPCEDREFGLALNEARDVVRREHHVEFVGEAHNPDTLVRANGKQVLDKMARFTRASVRKLRRVHDQGQVPNPAEMTDEDRERLQMAQDKTGMRLVQMDRINQTRKPIPMGNSEQPTFPGRPKK